MKDFIPYPRVFSILNLRWLLQTCESILVIVNDSLLEFGVPESITGRGNLGTARARHGAPSRRVAAALFLPRRRRRAKVPRRTALCPTDHSVGLNAAPHRQPAPTDQRISLFRSNQNSARISRPLESVVRSNQASSQIGYPLKS